jgi:hypothetical protein
MKVVYVIKSRSKDIITCSTLTVYKRGIKYGRNDSIKDNLQNKQNQIEKKRKAKGFIEYNKYTKKFNSKVSTKTKLKDA